MSLIEEFREIRRTDTPWCCVRTPDFRDTIRVLLRCLAEKPPAAVWDCVGGVTSPVRGENGKALGETCPKIGAEGDPPSVMLKAAVQQLPDNGILFMVTPDQTLWENAFTIQAAANLRDEFKGTRRTLVILGVNPRMPELLAEDVPILNQPLPRAEDLTDIAMEVSKGAGFPLKTADGKKTAVACLGMTRFSAESAIARKLRQKGMDFAGLNEVQRRVIEDSTDRALVFEKEKWTFDQIGGMSAFKQFMSAVFGGPKRPSVIVRVDEIEKSITAASSGQVADNTGVSQDILKVLLTALEDNKWMGLLACGGPGTGKTLASICVGNQFGCRTLALDLGAVKGSLVGESEGKIRRVVEVLKAVGGEDVMFVGTANALDTLPAALQRRFWLGTWYWDLPDAGERKQIWDIQRKRFEITDKSLPDDEGWTGSDIRNCTQMAWLCRSTLKEAAERITLAGRTSKEDVEKLRDLAERSEFRSASTPGPYRRAVKSAGRKVSVGN